MQKPYYYRVLEYSVIDGDTFFLTLDLGFKLSFKVKARLVKVDCPEIKTQEGKVVKYRVQEYLLGKEIYAESKELDKYGRSLVELYVDDKSLSNWLIDNKLAIIYK